MVEEGTTLYNDWVQPTRKIILDGVREVRNRREAKSMGWGRIEAEIPQLDLHFLEKCNPDLKSRDSSIKTKAWKKFLSSSASLAYRVQVKGGASNRSAGSLTQQILARTLAGRK